MKDPLAYFIEQQPYDATNVSQVVLGEKYTAVVLKNGDTGVCATLNYRIINKINRQPDKDLTDPSNRNLLIAYYNAIFNNNTTYDQSKDIFESVGFKKYRNVVMTGNFKPLVPKFRKAGINLHVFDLIEEAGVLPQQDYKKYLAKCDAHVLTSTSVFNRSFMEAQSSVTADADFYLLGPSTTMHPVYFEQYGFNSLFGTLIGKNNEQVLKIIAGGGGTRDFQKFCQKTVKINPVHA